MSTAPPNEDPNAFKGSGDTAGSLNPGNPGNSGNPGQPTPKPKASTFGAGASTGTLVLRLVIVLLLVLADQWSKSAVFEALEGGTQMVEGLDYDIHGHSRMPIFGNFLGFMLSENPGAAFGRFGDYPHLLIGGRIIAVAFLFWLLVSTRKGERLGTWAVVLVLSGALGNLVDNLWTGPMSDDHPYGKVRDFIDAWFLSDSRGWDYHFHTFNVADACISVGAVLWILSGLFARDRSEEDLSAEAEQTSAGDESLST